MPLMDSVLADAESEGKREHDVDRMELSTLEKFDETSSEEHKCGSSDCGDCNEIDSISSEKVNSQNVSNNTNTSISSSSGSGSIDQTHHPLRDRAISAPASGVKLSSLDKKLGLKPVIPEDEEIKRKPTATDWAVGVNNLSKLIGATLADEDRGVCCHFPQGM